MYSGRHYPGNAQGGGGTRQLLTGIVPPFGYKKMYSFYLKSIFYYLRIIQGQKKIHRLADAVIRTDLSFILIIFGQEFLFSSY